MVRGKEKRWGALFICLIMWKIYLEIADTLSADSCIMAIQRMTAGRGQPPVFWSDNGTNLCGAHEELKQVLGNLVFKSLTNYGTSMVQNGISFLRLHPIRVESRNP